MQTTVPTTGPTTVLERETTYDEGPGFLGLPDLRSVRGVATVDPPVTLHLRATYWDTADLRLAARRMTLRRRTGGEDDGWHLKVPAGTARSEHRLPLGDDPDGVPDALRTQVAGVLRAAELQPVVDLHTERHVHLVRDADGGVLAELAADRVTATVRTGDGDPEVLTWREWEAELVGGGTGLLRRLDRALRDAGLVEAAVGSKLLRALGDRVVPSAVLARLDGPERLPDGATGADLVLRYVARRVEDLVALGSRVRANEPDSVHAMRVATRRLRSVLASYRDVFERAATDPLRSELQQLAHLLGDARDAEVQRERLHDRLGRLGAAEIVGPVAERLAAEPAERYRAAHARVVRALDSERFHRLLDALDALVADPPLAEGADRPARATAVRAVRREWTKVQRALRAAEADGADEDWHEARKRLKRLRYAAESAAAVRPRAAARLRKAAARAQRPLGDHQDGVVARQLLREIAQHAHAAGESTFTYGVLHARETRAAGRDLRAFADGRRRLERRLRSW